MNRRHAISGLVATAATALVSTETAAAPEGYQATYENFQGIGYVSTTIRADETLSAPELLGDRTLAIGFARIHKVGEPYVEDGFYYDGWVADPISLISAEPIETFVEKSRFKLYEEFTDPQGVRIYTAWLG